MCCGLCLLGVVQDFLVEFFSVAQAGVLYFAVLCSAKVDHALCEVCNADGLSHVEDEDFSAFAHCSCFEHKFACFWYEHEIANDVGMCDSDGTSFCDLFFEEGYYACQTVW